jgi:hypothetical protein
MVLLCFNFIFILLHTQLEKAKKREAAYIVTFAKREQEIAELKVYPREASFCYETCPFNLLDIL